MLKSIHFSLSAAHPWLRDLNSTIPLDMMIYKLVKSYIRATPLKRAALKVCPHFMIHVSVYMMRASHMKMCLYVKSLRFSPSAGTFKSFDRGRAYLP